MNQLCSSHTHLVQLQPQTLHLSIATTVSIIRFKGNVVGAGNSNDGSIEYTVIIKDSGEVEYHYGPITDATATSSGLNISVFDTQLLTSRLIPGFSNASSGTSLSNTQVRITPVKQTIAQTPTVTFSCASQANQQCIELGLTGSQLSLTTPVNFNFGAIDSSRKAYSQNDTNYAATNNDVVSVTDLRGNGGFNLQLQADGGFTDGNGNFIPLQNMFVATAAPSTGGTVVDGVEYSGSATNPQNIVAPQNTTGSLFTTPSFTSCGSALGSGGTLTTAGTPDIIDLMIGGLSTGGRGGIFKQKVNYMLDTPNAVPAGAYTINLTYTLIDSTSNPPAQPASCP
jgi:hypothetical protein